MVRITVEVSNGAACCRVAVQAQSIQRAVEIVEELNPGSDFRVTFPIDPEAFFIEDPTARAGLIEHEAPATWDKANLRGLSADPLPVLGG
ncbi:MAG: hypothetical protein JOZ19_09770 [Rubrobacter sp.]|nr:hypothetical protein [Rubrobacter sp.]